MSVNGITSANSSYTTPQTTAKTKVSQTTNTADAKDIGVVYEASSKTDDKSNKIKDYSSVVATMKKELSTKNEQISKFGILSCLFAKKFCYQILKLFIFR